MHVVVGLGNPGPEYEGSRHNVGFAVLEELRRRWELSLGPVRHGVRVGRGTVVGKLVALIEPQMYMNRSGSALVQAARYIETTELTVIHDDLDLEPGCVRVKRGGGTAGHHGLDSIVECFGQEFTRVRVGIGRPPQGRDAVNYVLSKFSNEESEIITGAIRRAADAVECILVDGPERTMNMFNSRVASQQSSPADPVGRK
jgi:PTH1 family peptidyl-tRNA hydrolase